MASENGDMEIMQSIKIKSNPSQDWGRKTNSASLDQQLPLPYLYSISRLPSFWRSAGVSREAVHLGQI